MSRQVAILGGGDWYDASVEHVTVPDDMDLEFERKMHQKWYDFEYVPELRRSNVDPTKQRPKYIKLVDWLRQRGATDSTVEIFDDRL